MDGRFFVNAVALPLTDLCGSALDSFLYNICGKSVVILLGRK